MLLGGDLSSQGGELDLATGSMFPDSLVPPAHLPKLVGLLMVLPFGPETTQDIQGEERGAQRCVLSGPPQGGAPQGGAGKGGGPKIARFFSLSHVLSLSLLGVFSWNFGGV